MMELTSQFECGSGTPIHIEGDRWRLQTVADAFGYNKYFCVRACQPKDAGDAMLRLMVLPDQECGKDHFMTHYPSHVWYGDHHFARWAPLQRTWERSVRTLDDRLELRVPVKAGQALYIASNVPLPYSKLTTWIACTRDKFGSRVEVDQIGMTPEHRPIPVVRLRGTGPRLLVLAGQHASEHSGVWAATGIVDYLLSSMKEAAAIATAFDIAVIPMLNPDGNVHGHSGGGPQNLSVNNSLDFTGVADGATPQWHENRLLWQWLAEQFQPAVLLHFHGYQGWRKAMDMPGDGVYAHPDIAPWITDPKCPVAQHVILDRLRFQTFGFSSHFPRTGTLMEASVDAQLARAYGTVGVLYEINSSTVGPGEQYRRGPQVLSALTQAVLEDLPKI